MCLALLGCLPHFQHVGVHVVYLFDFSALCATCCAPSQLAAHALARVPGGLAIRSALPPLHACATNRGPGVAQCGRSAVRSLDSSACPMSHDEAAELLCSEQKVREQSSIDRVGRRCRARM